MCDEGCICEGKWREIIRRNLPFLDKKFVDEQGKEWTFYGIVHGSDDYYYGMCDDEGRLALLSCVGSIASQGFRLIGKVCTSDRVGSFWG